ncbi:MAG: T9SS type B sorting domain-containing protein [Chitinophagaceae bacterium]
MLTLMKVFQFWLSIILIFFLSFFSTQARGQIVINELGIAPPFNNFGQGSEFVELYNKGGCSVNIGCFVLVFSSTDNRGIFGTYVTGWTITIPANTILLPDSYYLVGGCGRTTALISSSWTSLAPGGSQWKNIYGTNGNYAANLDVSTSYNSAKNNVPGLLTDQKGQVSLLGPFGAPVASVSYNSSNNPNSYTGSFSNPATGCTAINPIPNYGPSLDNVNYGTTFNTFSQGIYLDASGNYLVAYDKLTPGKPNFSQLVNTPAPLAPTVNVTQPTCTTPSGTITVTSPTGSGLTYSIDGINYSNTTGIFSGVAPNTYNVTVKNSSGCPSAPTSAIVNAQPSAPLPPTVNVTQPTCTTPSGTITVTSPTGSGLTYSIDGINYSNTTGIFSGVAPNTYNVTVKNSSGCPSAPTSAIVNAQPSAPLAPTVNDVTYCQNATVIPLNATGNNLLWYTTAIDGSGNSTAPTPSTINTGTTSYWVSQTLNSCESLRAEIKVTVTIQITPTFTQIGPLCQNTTPPALPATSDNNITGAWSPATINTSTVGTATYTFTPSSGCATTATMSITIGTSVTPTFTQIGPLCQNTTPPALPATSDNNITGAWSPATINTSTVGTATYTFTPSSGCATTATMSITIGTSVTPTFTQIGPLCQNTTPPALPATSDNNITGAWSPATINTSTVGTATYTFTPSSGCATTATMSITIGTSVTPTFTQIGPLCQNTTPPALPATSDNNITGAWSPATINTSTVGTATYTFTPSSGCATTATMSITIGTSVTPTFTQIGPLCQNTTPPALPATSDNNITGAWSPATINTSTVGTATYTFTPSSGCATTATMSITIGTSVTPTFTQIGPLCQNTTPPALPATSDNNITGAWSPATINTSTVGTATYTFTPSSGCATTATMSITIGTSVTPTFTQIGPLCQNTTPPALPATSDNNITGAWSPATINTSTVGTATYTFTPSSGCATTATMSITIGTSVTPTFTQIGPLCQNTTPPALPATSDNNITGAWSPATINTSTVGTATYTFTPSSGCATTATMSITIGTSVTPTFTQIGPLCQNTTPPALPATSDNNITGAWSPATINTSTVGTATYTFTPSSGCATTATMSITIGTSVTPTFTQIGPLCQNTTPPALPATSDNNITGAWSPATINTSTVGTATYTFTPSSGCATTATMSITIGTSVTPTFTQIGPLCQNTTPPALPATSDNNITGAWSPATINTSTVGTATYTFTPSSGCATTATMSITIGTSVTPTFTQIGPLCQNTTPPALPATSDNNITGAWSPATINTSTVGTATYTFTPSSGCATTATMSITIGTSVTPTFTQIGPLCQNTTPPALPATSDNNITGAWSPATINTSTVGTATYTFTPSSGCATTATMSITIGTSVTPTFTQIGPLCQNTTPPALPATSDNNITGAWSPATINTSTVGTATYTFTPSSGCATTATMSITIGTSVTPTFTQIGPLCQNTTPPALPATSDNNITGAWSPATINTSTVGTATYTFTPNPGVCATIFTMDIVVATTISPIRYTTINASANAPKQLQARTITPSDKYTWSPYVGLDNYSINTPVFNYDISVEYLISIDAGTACTVVDTLLVKVFPSSGSPAQLSEIFGPKAFSPNGDGHNDKLTPLLFKIKDFKYFRVYNRWGQIVFETNIRGEGWDGTFKGQPLGADIFTWTVEGLGEDNRKHVKKGTSILLR